MENKETTASEDSQMEQRAEGGVDGVRGGGGTEVISCGQTAPLSVDRDERRDHGNSALLVFICCLNHSCSLWHLLLIQLFPGCPSSFIYFD